MHPFGQKGVIDASVSSYYTKHYAIWFIHNMIIPNVCVSGYDVLIDFGVSFLSHFGSICICFLKLLLVFGC